MVDELPGVNKEKWLSSEETDQVAQAVKIQECVAYGDGDFGWDSH